MQSTIIPKLRQIEETPLEPTLKAWQAAYADLIEHVQINNAREQAKISAVVVGWRATVCLIEVLDQIRTQHNMKVDDVQLIFVDNGGNQDLLEHVNDRADIIVSTTHNLGPSGGRNAGACYASAPVIAFVDDDAWIDQHYFERGLEHLEHPNVAAIRGRVLPKHHRYFTTLASHYDRGEHPVDDCLITEGASFIKQPIYLEVGGFANTLYGHEGIDLTHRIEQLGRHLRTVYMPDVVMYHDYYNGLGKFIKKSLNYNNLNSRVASRDESLEQFMDAYFSRTFTHRKRTLSEHVARTSLLASRHILQRCARWLRDTSK